MGLLGRAYRDAREDDGLMPPPAMDDAIRAAARRAVSARPRPVDKSWVRKWTPQLAAAAVVVLSVSVIFVSVEERPDLAPPSIQIAMKQPAEALVEESVVQESKAAAAALAPGAKRDAAANKIPAESAPMVADAQLLRQKKAQTVAKEERAASFAAAPQPPRSVATAGAAPAAAPVYAPPPAPALLTPAAPSVQTPAAANVSPAPFPATAAETAAPMRKEARTDTRLAAVSEPKPLEEKAIVAGALRARDTGSDAPAKPVSPLAAPAPALVTPATPAVAAAPARALEYDASRRNVPPETSAGARDFSKDEYKLSDKLADDERPGPWLKRMTELREQGKLKELREEIARFRKRHPDVVLPKALTELPANN